MRAKCNYFSRSIIYKTNELININATAQYRVFPRVTTNRFVVNHQPRYSAKYRDVCVCCADNAYPAAICCEYMLYIEVHIY